MQAVSISVEPLQIGSPGFLPERSSYGNHYFIAALVPLTLEPPEEADPSCPPQRIPTNVGTRYATPGRRFTTLPSTGPFEGLLMGVLLGRGTFGRVYRGLWKGQLVAVKVTTKLLIIYRRSSSSLLPGSQGDASSMSNQWCWCWCCCSCCAA